MTDCSKSILVPYQTRSSQNILFFFFFFTEHSLQRNWRSTFLVQGMSGFFSPPSSSWQREVAESMKELYLPQMGNINIEVPWTEDSKLVLEQSQALVNLLCRRLHLNDQQSLQLLPCSKAGQTRDLAGWLFHYFSFEDLLNHTFLEPRDKNTL